MFHPCCSHARGILCEIHTSCMGVPFPTVYAKWSTVFQSFPTSPRLYYNNNNNNNINISVLQVASVFYYLCVVALQCILPLLLSSVLAFMLKTLGGLYAMFGSLFLIVSVCYCMTVLSYTIHAYNIIACFVLQ